MFRLFPHLGALLVGSVFLAAVAGCSHTDTPAPPPMAVVSTPAAPPPANPAVAPASSGDADRYKKLLQENPSIQPGARGPAQAPGH